MHGYAPTMTTVPRSQVASSIVSTGPSSLEKSVRSASLHPSTTTHSISGGSSSRRGYQATANLTVVPTTEYDAAVSRSLNFVGPDASLLTPAQRQRSRYTTHALSTTPLHHHHVSITSIHQQPHSVTPLTLPLLPLSSPVSTTPLHGIDAEGEEEETKEEQTDDAEEVVGDLLEQTNPSVLYESQMDESEVETELHELGFKKTKLIGRGMSGQVWLMEAVPPVRKKKRTSSATSSQVLPAVHPPSSSHALPSLPHSTPDSIRSLAFSSSISFPMSQSDPKNKRPRRSRKVGAEWVLGRQYAIKVIHVVGGIPRYVLSEIAAQRAMSHPNVLGLYRVIELQRSNSIALVMPLENKSLVDYMASESNYDSASPKRHDHIHERLRIVRGLNLGLHYMLYRAGFMHLDIKPENILVGEDLVPKFADFGFAQWVHSLQSDCRTNDLGSWWWHSPEQRCGARYTRANDIWALSIVKIELLFRTHPFRHLRPEHEHLMLLAIALTVGWPASFAARIRAAASARRNHDTDGAAKVAAGAAQTSYQPPPAGELDSELAVAYTYIEHVPGVGPQKSPDELARSILGPTYVAWQAYYGRTYFAQLWQHLWCGLQVDPSLRSLNDDDFLVATVPPGRGDASPTTLSTLPSPEVHSLEELVRVRPVDFTKVARNSTVHALTRQKAQLLWLQFESSPLAALLFEHEAKRRRLPSFASSSPAAGDEEEDDEAEEAEESAAVSTTASTDAQYKRWMSRTRTTMKLATLSVAASLMCDQYHVPHDRFTRVLRYDQYLRRALDYRFWRSPSDSSSPPPSSSSFAL